MMTVLEWIVAMVSALLSGGLGAYAVYVRAKGQNKVELEAQLTERTFKFQDRVTAQLGAYEARIDLLEKRNDDLFEKNQQHITNVAVLTEQNKQLTRELTELRETLRQMREDSQKRAMAISSLEKDVAAALEKYQVEVAKVAYLESKISEKEKEIERLHAALPVRTKEMKDAA